MSCWRLAKTFDLKPFGVKFSGCSAWRRSTSLSGTTQTVVDPLDADLKWVVKLDKPDYIRRRAHKHVQAHAGNNRLVPFHRSIEEGRRWQRGCNSRQARRANHQRSFQPTFKKICWTCLGAHRALDWWLRVRLSVDGTVHPAVVVDKPFYDPEGKRLK